MEARGGEGGGENLGAGSTPLAHGGSWPACLAVSARGPLPPPPLKFGRGVPFWNLLSGVGAPKQPLSWRGLRLSYWDLEATPSLLSSSPEFSGETGREGIGRPGHSESTDQLRALLPACALWGDAREQAGGQDATLASTGPAAPEYLFPA